MKMLFFSSDASEVERVGDEFVRAGIPCEIREGPALNGKAHRPPQAELWIRNDRDCHRAFMLCVHLGVGFAKRAARRPMFDNSDLEPPVEESLPPEEQDGDKPQTDRSRKP